FGDVHSVLQSDWTGAGTGVAHGSADCSAGMRAAHLVLLSLPGAAGQRAGGIPVALYRAAGGHAARGPVVIAGPVVSNRDFQPFSPRVVTDGSSFREHVRGRDGDAGIFLAGAAGHSDHILGLARRRV